MEATGIRVAVDIGCSQHQVAIGGPENNILDEFEFKHNADGIKEFFRRIEKQEEQLGLDVSVVMEGFNGYARPLDTQVLLHDWRLFNINNLKLARYKEIFPGPAKTDLIDTRKMLELFTLNSHLPVAKGVLQEIVPIGVENEKLKRLTRRRRQLVNEKVRVVNRIQSDLHAVCPGLLDITGSVDNLWFLHFLTYRNDLTKLSKLHFSTILKIDGVGNKYAQKITEWQDNTHFAKQVGWVGQMILDDARRILELIEQIDTMEETVEDLCADSEIASSVKSIPGFGVVCSGELAGEIGTLDRFPSESSLALYVGMAVLDAKSGIRTGVKAARHINRRAKAALMTALSRHIVAVPESRKYYKRKRAEGKKHNQAIRALGRHMVRVIWSLVKQQRNYQIVDL